MPRLEMDSVDLEKKKKVSSQSGRASHAIIPSEATMTGHQHSAQTLGLGGELKS